MWHNTYIVSWPLSMTLATSSQRKEKIPPLKPRARKVKSHIEPTSVLFLGWGRGRGDAGGDVFIPLFKSCIAPWPMHNACSILESLRFPLSLCVQEKRANQPQWLAEHLFNIWWYGYWASNGGQKVQNVILRGLGDTDLWKKNLKMKISCQAPFKLYYVTLYLFRQRIQRLHDRLWGLYP